MVVCGLVGAVKLKAAVGEGLAANSWASFGEVIGGFEIDGVCIARVDSAFALAVSTIGLA